MTRIIWAPSGRRFYEIGLDRGVFYPDFGAGVPWNGLVAINEDVDDNTQNILYLDGVRYISSVALGSFKAKLSAITYPEEFEGYDGYDDILSAQPRKPFSLCYRTRIGNDSEGSLHGYKLHLVYNVLASPTTVPNQTLVTGSEIDLFEWDVSTLPEPIPDLRASSHLIVDSRTTNPTVLLTLENWLYGSDEEIPIMPRIDQVLNLFEEHAIFKVVDNGDGTATVSGPDDAVFPLGYDDLWQLSYISVNQLSEFTYRASSY